MKNEQPEQNLPAKVQHKAVIDHQRQGPLVDYLAEQTTLSKIKIKKAIGAGGCWIKRSHVKSKKLQRLRKLKYILQPGDILEFYFDENALSYDGAPPIPLYEAKDWGLWFKPVNVLSGPSRYGEVCAIDFLVQQVSDHDNIFIVNRLDREASGIMVLGYSRRGAAKLSELWHSNEVEKFYQLEVLGVPEETKGEITFPLDGKTARTEYEVVDVQTAKSGRVTSRIKACIRTGRFHQIRRHFSKLGHPVMGDPRYGQNNGHIHGLQLVSSEVQFRCPFSKRAIHVFAPTEHLLW